MNKGIKGAIIALVIIAIAISGAFLVKYVIGGNSKKSFMTSAKQLYEMALREKSTDTKYYDNKSNKVSNSDLSYHVEFDDEGNIVYFLAYDEKHVIEVEKERIEEKDFEQETNYSDLSNKNYVSSLDYKHDVLNKKYLSTTSEYNNDIDNPEYETAPSPQPEESTLDLPSSSESKEETPKYKLTFNLNGGSGGQTTTIEVKYNEIMPSIKIKPSKNGYVFMGWYDNVDYLKGKQYYNEKLESTKYYDRKADLILYAGWKKLEPSSTPVTPQYDKITYTIDNSSSRCKRISTKGHTEGIENNSYVYSIHMGRVPNACYKVEITRVVIDDNDNAKIYVKNYYPSISSNCAQVISYPCATVTFSRKPNNIETIEDSEPTQPVNENDSDDLTYVIEKTKNCNQNGLPSVNGFTTRSTNNGYEIIVGLGRKNHGGYSVTIDSVNIDSNNNVIINATSTSPEPGAITTQAINYPCAVVTMNKEPNSLKVYLDGVDQSTNPGGTGVIK